VGGSSTIQTLSHDSSSIEIEVYNNGRTLRLLKFLFFIYKCAVHILSRVLPHPLSSHMILWISLNLNFTWTTQS